MSTATDHEPDQFVPHLGTGTIRPICTGECGLILCDEYAGADAWLAMPEALLLTDWR